MNLFKNNKSLSPLLVTGTNLCLVLKSPLFCFLQNLCSCGGANAGNPKGAHAQDIIQSLDLTGSFHCTEGEHSLRISLST